MPSTYVFSEVESPPRSTIYASRVLINMKSTKEALKFVNILPQLRPVPSFRRSNIDYRTDRQTDPHHAHTYSYTG